MMRLPVFFVLRFTHPRPLSSKERGALFSDRFKQARRFPWMETGVQRKGEQNLLTAPALLPHTDPSFRLIPSLPYCRPYRRIPRKGYKPNSPHRSAFLPRGFERR